MKRRVIAFDLDDTLAVTKSPISDQMGGLLNKLLEKYEVCIISGGKFEQFRLQVVDRLEADEVLLHKLHLMPTCGTRYYRYDDLDHEWVQRYANDFTAEEKQHIISVLTDGAKAVGLWEAKPYGEIIEDRGSQITFSALGQQAPAEKKYKWDPDTTKRQKLREYALPKLLDLEVRIGGTTSVDITRIGIDKAYGMGKLMHELQIGRDDILFVGDRLDEGGNDYPVKAMGIDTVEVTCWEDTARVVDAIIKVTE